MRNTRATPMMGLMALAVASPTLVAGQTNSQSSMSRTLQVNSLNDFCLFAPPRAGVTIGDSEAYEVAYCTAPNRGTRSMPAGTIESAREFDGAQATPSKGCDPEEQCAEDISYSFTDFLETPHYTQITGTGDFTKINVQRGDEGGELDPHGATGQGNPVGGVVYSGGTQVYEWHEFISDTEFCIRVCKPSVPDAWLWCQHIYDLQGCGWNDPGQYGSGFDTCEGDGTDYPPGIYPVAGGGFTTYEQGDGSTPAPPAHVAGASSNCVAQNTINGNAGPVTRASSASPSASSAASASGSASRPSSGSSAGSASRSSSESSVGSSARSSVGSSVGSSARFSGGSSAGSSAGSASGYKGSRSASGVSSQSNGSSSSYAPSSSPISSTSAVVTNPVTTTAALYTTTTASTTLAVVTVFSTASTASTSAIAATSSAAVRTTSGAVSMNPKVLLGVGASIFSVLFTLALFA